MNARGVVRIFGFVHLDARPASAETLHRMGSAMEVAHRWGGGADRRSSLSISRRVVVEGAAAMGCIRIGAQHDLGGDPPGDSGGGPSIDPWADGATGILVAADLVPNQDPASSRSAPSTGRTLAEAYLRKGPGFPSLLDGDFALALWDSRRRGLLLARDPLGCAPLFYARRGDTVLFASNLNGVVAGMGEAPTLAPEWVAGYLAGDEGGDLERTAFPHIKRLPAGHRLWVTPSASGVERYWDLEADHETGSRCHRDYEEALRGHLERAVRSRVPAADGVLGAELSGGLDSSVVATLAHREARARDLPFVALSHQLPDAALDRVWPFRDEREWAERVRRHAGMERHLPVTGEGEPLLEGIRQAVRLHGAPPEGGYSILPAALYGRARDEGVTHLFSGFGGDEGVSSSGSLALEGWIVRREWKALVREWRARGTPGAVASRRALVRQILSLSLRVDRRTKARFRKLADERSRWLLATLPVDPQRASEWQLAHRAGATWYRQAEAVAESELRQLHRENLLRGETSLRLEASAIAAGAQGITFRYPLLDPHMLRFFQGVPDHLKYRGGWGRHLFRRAAAGIVPDEVRLRVDKQGVTVPTVMSRLLADEGEVRSLIQSCDGLPGCDFLDLEKVDSWLSRIAEQARPQERDKGMKDLFLGRFLRVVGLLVYVEAERSGWRPGSLA